MQRRPTVFWGTLLCTGLAAGLAGAWLLRGNSPRNPVPPSPLPPVVSSPYRNTQADVAYVGSQACIDCHSAQYDSYRQTAHSQSLREMSRVDETVDAEVVHGPRFYTAYRQGGEVRHRESIRLPGGDILPLADFPVRFEIGSGNHAKSYLIEDDGFLVESPISWYAMHDQWELSPGYVEHYAGFGRPVYAECLECHVGQVAPADKESFRFEIHEQSIGCERCHGPGASHVEQQLAAAGSSNATGPTIVHPAKLSRELNEAICAQCHLHSDATAHVRGRDLHDFRPGLRIRDFRIDYALADEERKLMTVDGHMEQLHLSKCYTASETLTCTTCHNPHDSPSREEAVAHYRRKCLTCHDRHGCGLELAVRQQRQPADDCAACHMPQVPTDISHTAFTHHRIAVHEDHVPDGPVVRDATARTAKLVPLVDVSHLPAVEQRRCLGLGYLEVSFKETDPVRSDAYRHQARKLLEETMEAGIDDPAVTTALARIYERQDPQRAIDYAERALNAADLERKTRVDALFALSNAYLQLKQTDRATPILRQLTQLRRQAGDWFYLSACLYRAGKLHEAFQAAKRAAEIRPDRSNIQELLSELSARLGDANRAREHRVRARILRQIEESPLRSAQPIAPP